MRADQPRWPEAGSVGSSDSGRMPTCDAPAAAGCHAAVDAGSTFIFGLPMNCATKTLAGRWYSSRGVPTCSMMPPLNTAMRSPMVIASTWSWVT